MLHEWTIAWVAHQIVHDPLHIFDANIFYPARRALAFSDHLIPQSLAVAPVLWAGGSPVLAYNLLLMAGMTLTGWAMAIVVHRWTHSWTAGVMSGSLVAFNAFTLTQLPQLQNQHLEFFPLALLALDRLLEQPRVKHALALAGWFVLQAATAGYLLVFTSLALVAAVGVRPSEWLARKPRTTGYLLLAAALSVVALLPFLMPYYLVNRDEGLRRSLADGASLSASFGDYLATGGRLHFESWSRRFWEGDGLFPGVIGLCLAAVAIASGRVIHDRRARMALGIGVVAFAFSFGPAFPPYRWLFAVFPLMSGIRSPVRFGQFFLAAVAILAGYGVARLQQRARRFAIPMCAALLIGAHLEALRAPIAYSAYLGIPPVYDRLRNTGPAVLAFFPFYSGRQWHTNTRYMLVSTLFWTPMLNGYSGFRPAAFARHEAALGEFPDRSSIDYLRRVGVNYVVVEGHRMPPSNLARLGDFPEELQLWTTDGNLRVYSLKQ